MNTINWYINKLEELDAETFITPHQITIDLIEHTLDVLREHKNKPIVPLNALLNSLSYYVNNLIEVMNIEFDKDIDTLHKLSDILNS